MVNGTVDPHSDAARRLADAPPEVRWVVRTLEGAGFDTWAVGGAVRDALLGQPVTEWDFATRARPREVRKVFRRTVPVGVDHGTVGVLGGSGVMYEVTTFRRDVIPMGRRAQVEFAERIEDDLSRRDFTFNALAWHPVREEFLDLFGGLDDLTNGILRTVGHAEERFREDYLRVLRALRFAGRFHLRVEPNTWTALLEAMPRITRLSGERIREELFKVLGHTRPSAALALYGLSGAWSMLFPELAPEPSTTSGGRFGSALLTVDRIARHRTDVRLAALMRAAGTAELEPTLERLRSLRFSNHEIALVRDLCAEAGELPVGETDRVALRRWLSRGGRIRLRDRIRLAFGRARVADEREGSMPEAVLATARAVRNELARRPPLASSDLAIDGHRLQELGLRPGPVFRSVLGALLDDVLDDPSRNTPDYLERRVLELKEEEVM